MIGNLLKSYKSFCLLIPTSIPWFEDSYIIAIEPLADKFKSISFCDLDKANELYSEPPIGVEELPPNLMRYVGGLSNPLPYTL